LNGLSNSEPRPKAVSRHRGLTVWQAMPEANRARGRVSFSQPSTAPFCGAAARPNSSRPRPRRLEPLRRKHSSLPLDGFGVSRDNSRMIDRADPSLLPPILSGKDHGAASVFEPANLLREARRQKLVPEAAVPEVCILDPDGDILRALRGAGRAEPSTAWACYHTELFEFEHEGIRFGIIGCAVGASFAVLVAEQLFVCGCRFLVSVTSAGQIVPRGPLPYFVVIDRALRDEGTSYHYLPPSDFAEADVPLVTFATDALRDVGHSVHRGASWTTDAPFRETAAAIERARDRDILAVEMEAAALYAFAQARHKPVLCLAHVTNQMAIETGDFEKGEAAGAQASLAVVAAVAGAWLNRR
jgi:uridine phosphorylase